MLFKWITDHKGLTHLLNQAHWIEKISSFNFEVVYVTGTENVVADALLRMYSNNVPGTVRAQTQAAVYRRPRKTVPGAETGHSETFRQFAARMHDNFVLRGPVQ
jgi:hypothetical protein